MTQPTPKSECGIIESVHMENFMCHENLKIDLCPRINYITGQNGSGKSAILIALQMCLGARSSSTHRAKETAGRFIVPRPLPDTVSLLSHGLLELRP